MKSRGFPRGKRFAMRVPPGYLSKSSQLTILLIGRPDGRYVQPGTFPRFRLGPLGVSLGGSWRGPPRETTWGTPGGTKFATQTVAGCVGSPGLVIPSLGREENGQDGSAPSLQSGCTERSNHTCTRVPADLALAPDGGGKVEGGSGEGFHEVLHGET
jgi:hypothetical protein